MDIDMEIDIDIITVEVRLVRRGKMATVKPSQVPSSQGQLTYVAPRQTQATRY
jgi:hypothetical protein